MPRKDIAKDGEKTQFKPGQSGNPEGPKPGYRQARTVLKELLAVELDDVNPLTGEKGKYTVADLLHLQQIKKAKEGDTSAYKEIQDRVDGKAPQSLELTGKDGGPIETSWIIEIEKPDGNDGNEPG